MELVVMGVSVRYNSVDVLRDVSFIVGPGELVFVLGPNGAGKTTLLKAVASMVRPYAGVIYIDGRDLRSYSPKELARTLSYVGPHVSTSLQPTVLEFLLIARYPHQGRFKYLESSEDLRVVEELVNSLDLRELAGRRLDTLSSGELQRVLIARALVQEPKLLLLDEPAAFLDIRYRLEILSMVRRVTKSRSLVTLATTHDVYLAALYADKVVILKDGKVVAAGDSEVLDERLVSDVFGVRVAVVRLSSGRRLVIPVSDEDAKGLPPDPRCATRWR